MPAIKIISIRTKIVSIIFYCKYFRLEQLKLLLHRFIDEITSVWLVSFQLSRHRRWRIPTSCKQRGQRISLLIWSVRPYKFYAKASGLLIGSKHCFRVICFIFQFTTNYIKKTKHNFFHISSVDLVNESSRARCSFFLHETLWHHNFQNK